MKRLTQKQEQLSYYFRNVAAWGIDTFDAMRLLTLAKTATHYNTLACNVELTERQEKRREKIDEEAVEIGKKYGMEIRTNGDPRGWPFKCNEDSAGRRIVADKPNFGVPDSGV